MTSGNETPAEKKAPRHGEERMSRPLEDLLETPAGKEHYQGPVSYLSEPFSERYCESCGAWKPLLRGFMARLIGGCPDCGRRW